MTSRDRKEQILEIARSVIPAIELKSAGGVLKAYQAQYFPHLKIPDLAEAILEEPDGFKRFCQQYFMFINKLDDNEVYQMLNLVRQANLPQLDQFINRALLYKANLLFLMNQKSDPTELDDKQILEF